MAITITSKAPAAANAAAPVDAAQPAAGADVFAALLGSELMQLVTGGDGALTKLDNGLPGAAAAKEDKAGEAGKAVDPSALAFLQTVALPVAPVQAKAAQASTADAQLDADGQIVAAAQLKAGAVQTEERGFLLLGRDKKLEEQQKLPLPAAEFAQFLPLAGQASHPVQGNTASQPLTMVVQTPIQDPSWGKAFGDQMLGMVSLKADTAHIQVNPPELGPIDVTLKIDSNNQAQVSFVTSNPVARDIVESHLSRLSSMLEASGIQLADAQVSTGQGNQQQAQQQQRKQHEDSSDETDTLAVIKAARGVLSIFA